LHAGFYLFDEEIDDPEFIQSKKDKEFATSYYQSDNYLRSELDLLNLTRTNPDALVCWFYLGQVYLNLKKWDEAITCFRNSLENERVQLQPEAKVWAFNLLGTCLLKANNPSEAMNKFQSALALECDYQNAKSYALNGISRTKLK
jgi:tetratricopeptide (TPR) repeat protein